MQTKKFSELSQGEKFRFDYETEGVVRTASQIGKTEIYCPRDTVNTVGHSMSGGEEVYVKSDRMVVLIDDKKEEAKSELKIDSYKSWDVHDLDNEIRYLYIEIGRMGRDGSDNINKIREMEAELVERKIKCIASEADIKRANAKRAQVTINQEIGSLLTRIERYKSMLGEIKSIYENKKEANGKSMTAVEHGILAKVEEALK